MAWFSGSGERKREPPALPLVGGKKAKSLAGGPTPLGRPTSSSPTAAGGVELWETQATDVEPSELVDAVLECCQASQFDKAVNNLKFYMNCLQELVPTRLLFR